MNEVEFYIRKSDEMNTEMVYSASNLQTILTQEIVGERIQKIFVRFNGRKDWAKKGENFFSCW